MRSPTTGQRAIFVTVDSSTTGTSPIGWISPSRRICSGSLAWEDVRNQEGSPKRIGQRKLADFFLRPPEELYDLEADPHEVYNLAKEPEHQERLERMRAKLEQWQLKTEDPWLYRDGVSLKFVQHHLDEGLKIPDRFDLDPSKPENRGEGVKLWGKKPFGQNDQDVFVIR